jgi:hypothetical protein
VFCVLSNEIKTLDKGDQDMQHLLTILNKAEPQRLAKAAAGLVDRCLTVKLVYHGQDGIRAVVKHGEQEYRVMVNAEASFCSCPDAFYRCGLSDQPIYCKHRLATALYTLGHQPKKTENAPSAPQAEQRQIHYLRPDNTPWCGREGSHSDWAWGSYPEDKTAWSRPICVTCEAIVHMPKDTLNGATNTAQSEAAA